MRPIRRILVAVKDPGANTLPAVAKAARIARACGAHLELFHALKASVWANNPTAYETALLDLQLTSGQQYLQRLGRIAARLRLHGIQVTTAVEYDYPAHEAIVRHAKATSADLIVASRSAGSLLRLTDWELLRQSPIPVLLVKKSGPYRHPNVLAAVDPCHAHSKPAQLDLEILSAAEQISRALQGKLHAVHAYAPVVIGAAAASVSDSVAARLDGIAASNARTEFDRLLEGDTIPRARRHLVGNLPGRAINEVARRIHAQIVVMGALSRTGLKRLIIGNTAEKLLDDLPCDILIVKPAQFVCRVPAKPVGPRPRAASGQVLQLRLDVRSEPGKGSEIGTA
jgi:universal stress protein E